MGFSKYVWKSSQLEKKAKQYDNITLGVMAGILLVFFFAPGQIKLLNIPLIFVGMVLFYLSYRIKMQDRKIAPADKRPIRVVKP